MNELEQLLSLIQSKSAIVFAEQCHDFFLVRQRVNEILDTTGIFQTPVQLPAISPEKTLQPALNPSGSTSRGIKALVFRSEADILENFAAHRLVKSTRNAFSPGITLGRTQNNDIVLPVRAVSKFHAWLAQEGGRWYCYDAQSSYGTFVDQVQLQPSERRAVDLNSRIKVGEVTLTFVDAKGLHYWVTARLALIKK